MTDRNPFKYDTPEWQLCENAILTEQLAIAHENDAERFQKLSAEARKKAELYWVALEKLGFPKETADEAG